MAPLAVLREALCTDGQSGSSVLAGDTVSGGKQRRRKKETSVLKSHPVLYTMGTYK